MSYASEDMIALLRAARLAQGLTQRELGERIGSPQSYVARLEAGGTDPRMSSLVEVARALDLDLKLVPRQAVPVVDAALRANSLDQLPGDATSRAFLTIRNFLTRLDRMPYLNEKTRGTLTSQLADLELLRYADFDYQALQAALRPMNRVLDKVEGGEAVDAHWPRRLRDTREKLESLRNMMAHARPDVPRSAFALDDDDA